MFSWQYLFGQFLIMIILKHCLILFGDNHIKPDSNSKKSILNQDLGNHFNSRFLSLSNFSTYSQNKANQRQNFPFNNKYFLKTLSSNSSPKSPLRSSHISLLKKKLSHFWRPLMSSRGDKKSNRFKSFKKRPNIIFILTDDQDIELGSMNFMPKTIKILANEGAHFKNAYVTTPMCCPSRSSILTGLYTHNHNVYTNNDNCSSPQWQSTHETRTFATFLSNAGYRTAFFGKYLNEYNGSYIPPGWKEWSALIKNSRFYNYSINVNGRKVKHFDNYYLDYYSDLITNDSLAFLRKSKQMVNNKPLLMVLSYPSPHGPEDAAPQHQNLFFNVTTHQTPSWNHAPNPDKQWLLRHTQKMTQLNIDFTNLLHTKRLQTLQSVDDAVEKLYNELKHIGELENTYIFYTSDHGYHLGQFGLVKGKSMPFEFDIRVPFYVRGPKIKPGIVLRDIVLNIDIAPTILDIAKVPIPDYVDGKSILSLLHHKSEELKHRKSWRDTFLIERGKIIHEDNNGPLNLNKKQWLKLECQKPEHSSPCARHQKWECVYDDYTHRIRKCRSFESKTLPHFKNNCLCPNFNLNNPLLVKDYHSQALQIYNSSGQLFQMKFFKDRYKNYFKPYLSHSQNRKSRDADFSFNLEGVYDLSRLLDSTFNKNISKKFFKNFELLQYHEQSGCFIFANNSIVCPQEVYYNENIWKKKKDRVDHLIKRLQVTLQKLRGIRRHLKHRRPNFGEEKTNKKTNCECEEQVDTHSIRRKYTRIFRIENLKKKDRKLRRKVKFENTTCNIEKMNCFTHDKFHWKTPPLWTQQPFCFCQNSNNNTFWCLRTINETHNFLYCEFITGFLSYYDLNQDPYQLKNTIFSLDWSVLKKLRKQLIKLKNCSGFKQCNSRFKPNISVKKGF